MKIGLVQPADIPVIWPHVKFKIQRAMIKVDLNPFEGVEADVLAGRADLWIAYDLEKIHAAATTLVTDGICEIIACGGSRMKDFLPLIKQIEFVAKQFGCKAIRITGRKGWSRVLPDYKPKAFIIERAL